MREDLSDRPRLGDEGDEPDVSGRDPDTIPSVELRPPGRHTESDRRTAENASLGPDRCERPVSVRERPEARLPAGLWAG